MTTQNADNDDEYDKEDDRLTHPPNPSHSLAGLKGNRVNNKSPNEYNIKID